MVINHIWLINWLPSLIARRRVGPQTKRRLLPQSVTDGWRLTINVCSRTHCGPVCDFLVFRLQIVIELFILFHHIVLIICGSL